MAEIAETTQPAQPEDGVTGPQGALEERILGDEERPRPPVITSEEAEAPEPSVEPATEVAEEPISKKKAKRKRKGRGRKGKAAEEPATEGEGSSSDGTSASNVSSDRDTSGDDDDESNSKGGDSDGDGDT